MNTIVLLKFLGRAALPPASLVVGLLFAGALAVVGWRRLARLLAIVAVLETAVLSLPLVSDLLMAPLENEARAAARRRRPAATRRS